MAVNHPPSRPGERADAGRPAAAPDQVAGPAGEPAASGGPLAGVHVLDLARVLAGPYAAMLLADLGAEVIKVERPGAGDDTRQWGPPFMPAGDGVESTYFLSVNRGKRSVAIDLKDPAERVFVEALVRWADVLIENFRPGVMDRLGLGDDHLTQLNPHLVRLAISGFGENGPDSDRVGYDQILQAEGGLMSLTGTAASPAVKVGVPIADVSAGLFGVIGVLGALVERARGGLGQRVSTSLLAAQVGIHTFQGTRYLIAGQVPGPSGNHHPTVAPYGVFDAADGPMVIAVGNEHIWRRFAPLVGLEPADRRFATNALRLGHLDELHRILNAVLALRMVADWLHTLREAGVPAGELKTLDKVYDSEQAHAENLVWEVDHPLLGAIRVPGNPVRYSRSTLSPGLPPPTLGQHTAEVREALLGQARADGR
jgi:crotonobetainyl-CoA:carnitine CoA-transferase CaiB-like acyl-CoA transferase